MSKGWPQMHDLDSGQLFTENELVDEIGSYLDQQACLVVGPEGCGKTVLVRYIGYKCLRAKKYGVWHVDLSEEGGQNTNTVLHNIKEYGKEKNVLQILENVHTRADFWHAIVGEIARLQSRFLFTSRVKKEVPVATKEGLKAISFPLNKDRNKRFIEWYVQVHDDRFNGSPYVPPSISTIDWEYDMAWAYREFSLNLRSLTTCLQAWAQERPWRRLSVVSRNNLVRSIIEQRFKGLSLTEIATLIDISAVYQFEVPVWSEAINLAALEKLCQWGLIRLEQGYCYLEHATDAKHNVEGRAIQTNVDVEHITLSCFQDYLAKKPPNFNRVFLGLILHDEEQLAGALLRDEEIRRAAKSIMPLYDFRKMIVLLKLAGQADAETRKELAGHIVHHADPHVLAATVEKRTSIQTIYWFFVYLRNSKVDGWQDFVKEFIGNIEQEYLLSAMKFATAGTVNTFLKLVRRCAPVLHTELAGNIPPATWATIRQRSPLSETTRIMANLIFTKPSDQITPAEWVRAKSLAEAVLSSPNIDRQIRLTTVRNLSKLLSGFIHLDKRKGSKLAEEFAEKITQNVKLDRLEGQRGYRLGQISHLIHHVSAYPSLENLIKRVVAETNWAALVEKEEEVEAMALGITLWGALKVGKARELVAKIDEPTWLGLVRKTLNAPLTNIFWLLWNLYQADQNMCYAVLSNIQQDIGRLLRAQQPMQAESLALLGLLDLCNLKFVSVPIANLSELAEDLATRRNIGLFALILRYVRKLGATEACDFEQEFTSKLSTEHQGLSIEDLLEQFPAPSSRQILRNILALSESEKSV